MVQHSLVSLAAGPTMSTLLQYTPPTISESTIRRVCSLPDFLRFDTATTARGGSNRTTTEPVRAQAWLPGFPRVVWHVQSDLEGRAPSRPGKCELTIHYDSRPRRRVALQIIEFVHNRLGATLVVARFSFQTRAGTRPAPTGCVRPRRRVALQVALWILPHKRRVRSWSRRC